MVRLFWSLALALLAFATAWAQCPPGFGPPEKTGALESTDITEASGLAASWRNPGVLWTHNDGSRDAIYAVGRDGRHLGKYRLNKNVDDLEDIAVGPGPAQGVSYIYVGDIGSNDGSGSEVRVFRVPEPAVSLDQPPVKVDLTGVESITLKYPSGSHDAEALMVDPILRELFVVTKGSEKARIFKTSIDGWISGSKRTLDAAGEISFPQVSGGDISSTGSWIALRREDMAEFWLRRPGENVAEALQRPPIAMPVVGPPVEPNGEAIAFLPDGSGYMTTSEGVGQALYFFPITAAAPVEFSGTPRLNGPSVQFDIRGCSGGIVALERSVDLETWQEAARVQLTGSVQQVNDAAGILAHGYYRLKLVN